MTHLVATIVQEDANPFEFAVACEVFGLHRPGIGDWYEHRLCAPGGTVTVRGGWQLQAVQGLEGLAEADTIVVPNASTEPGANDPGVVEALAEAHRRGARMISFCSGAFALAEAGVLDGRPATTHWMYAERFRRRFPRVALDANVLFVDDGDVLTSAGTAAGIDLSLHVVRKDHGADVARYVARRMVVPPHRDGGQAQFIDPPHAPRIPSDDLAATLEWAQADLARPLTVHELAAHAAMSPRTFARRFKESVGTTPHRWLTTQRLHLAQQLLETTDLPVEVVAERTGFGTATNLRDRFRRELRTTPSGYRDAFRSAA